MEQESPEQPQGEYFSSMKELEQRLGHSFKGRAIMRHYSNLQDIMEGLYQGIGNEAQKYVNVSQGDEIIVFEPSEKGRACSLVLRYCVQTVINRGNGCVDVSGGTNKTDPQGNGERYAFVSFKLNPAHGIGTVTRNLETLQKNYGHAVDFREDEEQLTVLMPYKDPISLLQPSPQHS